MKTIVVFFVSLILLSSCSTSVRLVGEVNMISHRNIESKNYVLIKSYMGASPDEIKKARSQTIQAAVNETVKNTAGGEFLKNAKIYLVDGTYYAVEGDVWGLAENITFRGWRIGDKVQWLKYKSVVLSGTIIDLKNSEVCSVQQPDGKVVEVEYDKLKRFSDTEPITATPTPPKITDGYQLVSSLTEGQKVYVQYPYSSSPLIEATVLLADNSSLKATVKIVFRNDIREVKFRYSKIYTKP